MHTTFGRLLVIVVALVSGVVSAAAPEPYSDKRFNELTRAGRSVVLDVHATWCPTCKLQQPVLFKQVQTKPYQDFQVLVVDWDTHEPLRKRLRVHLPSTLIVYKGALETARRTGPIEAESIDALLATALH